MTLSPCTESGEGREAAAALNIVLCRRVRAFRGGFPLPGPLGAKSACQSPPPGWEPILYLKAAFLRNVGSLQRIQGARQMKPERTRPGAEASKNRRTPAVSRTSSGA